ncbi:MAG: energy transducer TonB [Armatimonadota bacterium]|nr:energy transducer TonB [Armatimonadota bacterium]MDR7437511.1 energy transducer TonB [Armatimonadota bacterium]MDR7507770.1 energy transducer TonB [Armatimonadota bacterium]MDR7509481.1 energy transducer TonB [Armatimonadota bacterium]MDR7516793.1 energy transducer TonB [Armatimonadota bacterium]
MKVRPAAAMVVAAAAAAAAAGGWWRTPVGERAPAPARLGAAYDRRAPTAEEEAGVAQEAAANWTPGDVGRISSPPSPSSSRPSPPRPGPSAHRAPAGTTAPSAGPARSTAAEKSAANRAGPAGVADDSDRGGTALPSRPGRRVEGGEGASVPAASSAGAEPAAGGEVSPAAAAGPPAASPPVLTPPVLLETGRLDYPQAGYRMVVDRDGLTAHARAEAVGGTVVLKVLVRADGTVGAVEVVRSSGHASLDEVAASSAWSWVFRPATRDGAPIDAWAVVPVTFGTE